MIHLVTLKDLMKNTGGNPILLCLSHQALMALAGSSPSSMQDVGDKVRNLQPNNGRKRGLGDLVGEV